MNSALSADAAGSQPDWASLLPLTLLHDKPLSTMWTAPARKALLKVYRQLEPRARRDREVDALALAGQWGLSVPAVRGIGDLGTSSWMLLDLVPGQPCRIGTADEVERYIWHAAALTSVLRTRSADLRPGNGWVQSRRDYMSHKEFLVDQLSPRCRAQTWWSALCNALSPLDEEQTVYLHGDIKPEHLLVGEDDVHVVDWEAAARGPAVCDTVHAVFHLLRDLVYSSVPPRAVPVEIVSSIPVPGGVAAWRIVHWLDRRRPQDLNALTADALSALLTSVTAADVVNELVRLIAELRDHGVPR
jgi:hypothetical protein